MHQDRLVKHSGEGEQDDFAVRACRLREVHMDEVNFAEKKYQRKKDYTEWECHCPYQRASVPARREVVNLYIPINTHCAAIIQIQKQALDPSATVQTTGHNA